MKNETRVHDLWFKSSGPNLPHRLLGYRPLGEDIL